VTGPPLLLVVDGNSLLHRAYHAAATGLLRDDDGRAVWALKGLVTAVARAAARLRPDAVLVGFDCPDHSARRADYPGYKAHRPDKPAELAEQLVDAPALVRAATVAVAVPAGYEADDVLASAAARARENDWRTVVVTGDRDAFALLDEHTSVLRVRTGGPVLVTPATLADLCGVQPWQYRDYAALRGDPSDNLPGVRGFGGTTAARLLAAFGSLDVAWAALDGGRGSDVEAAVGERAAAHLATPAARETVARNKRLMRMRVDVPLPDLDAMRLPLRLAAMRAALAVRGINLGPSLWALTDGSPPPDEPPPTRPRSARAWRRPGAGQLALF